MEKENAPQSLKARVHEFFENPKTPAAHATQFLIVALIILSIAIIAVEVFYEDVYLQHKESLDLGNDIILILFTIEYLARVLSAPKKIDYCLKPLNIVDFVSIFPNYLEIVLHLSGELFFTTWFRSIRLLRFLRFARFIRGLRLFRFGKTIKDLVLYEDTVLQAITPMMVMVISLKLIVWFFESRNLWISNSSIGDLFAIIGFALGIVLSQKIGVTYDKFIQVQDASVRIFASLQILRLILDKFRPGLGTGLCREWVRAFLRILQDPGADNYAIIPYNNKLFQAVSEVENAIPDQFWSIPNQIISDASLCLNKKVRLTPSTYDILLHQATVIYLFLIAVFIPGFTGIVSVALATYVLYGMYYITKDLDTIFGGEYDLINIDLSELKYFAEQVTD